LGADHQSPFKRLLSDVPRVLADSNLGLKLANAFGVIHAQNFKLRYYHSNLRNFSEPLIPFAILPDSLPD
jgi:hypothetical protein